MSTVTVTRYGIFDRHGKGAILAVPLPIAGSKHPAFAEPFFVLEDEAWTYARSLPNGAKDWDVRPVKSSWGI